MAGSTLQFFIQHYLVLNSIRFLDQSYFSDVYITNNLNNKKTNTNVTVQFGTKTFLLTSMEYL